MSAPVGDRDPFEMVAESFLARYRAGERPSVNDYAARAPRARRPDPPAAAGPGDDRAGRVDRRRARPLPDRRAGPGEPKAGRLATPGRLPDRPGDRTGRHGVRVRSRANLAGTARGLESAPPPRAARPQGAQAVPSRGQGSRAVAPHEHRACFRGRPGRRACLLHDAVHRRPGARPGYRRAGTAQ